MTFFLQKDGWINLADDPNARGVIMIDINAGGNRYCFSTVDVDVQSAATGPWMRFHGAIVNDPVHKETVDVFGRQPSVQDMKFTVMSDRFPLPIMRSTGMLLQDIKVDVYWHIIGRDFTFDQAFHLLRGRLQNPTYDEQSKLVSFRVEDSRLEGEKRFPPIVANQTRIPNLVGDHVGKPYPIIIGSTKKSPVLNVDGVVAANVFLAIGDPMDEYGGGAQVSEVYDGDIPLTVDSQSRQSDIDGNVYHQVTTVDNAASLDVTADVTGHSNTDVESVIRYLLTFFANDEDVFDLQSLRQVKSAMPNINLGMVFNSRNSRGGVLEVLIKRVLRLLPIGMIPRGGKYQFKPLLWDRDVMHHLSFEDGSIRECVAGPTETKRSEVFNEFVVRYNRSSLRGGQVSVLEKTSDNDQYCKMSESRYGRRTMGDINAGDLITDAGALWLIEWLVETFSRMRVFVSYRVNLGAVNVPLWSTIRVRDQYQNWDALFKVIGIKRGTSSDLIMDLVGIDDYSEIYKPLLPIESLWPPEDMPEKTVSVLLPLDLEAYYKLDIDALDSSPSGYDCTPTGINFGTPGKILTCAYYEDNADTIIADVWEGEGILADTPRTFSGWFRKNFFDLSADQIILYYGSAAGRHWEIQARRAAAAQPGCVGLRLGSTSFHWCDGLICDNTWKHFAITYSGVGTTAGIKFYVDGVEVLNKFSSGTQTVLTGQLAKVSMGNRSGANSIKWGQIDEVGVWSRELTAPEIWWLWNNGNGLPYN